MRPELFDRVANHIRGSIKADRAGLSRGHRDFSDLNVIAKALLDAAGGVSQLESIAAQIIRDCIDKVIQTPKTGRLFFKDLQNTEKTYIGTAVEIDLRTALNLPRGDVTDLRIGGYDVDVKFTRQYGWMIPPEAVGKPVLLISADDSKSRFSLGLAIAHEDYLNPGKNRDSKTTISAAGRSNIWWLLRDASYPENFWLTISPDAAQKIADGQSGNDRVVTLFREVLDRVVSRKIINDTARQLDFTRRLRADRGGGTRDRLLEEGIVILEGTKPKQRALVAELGLPSIKATEYLAHRFVTDKERQLAAQYGVTLNA